MSHVTYQSVPSTYTHQYHRNYLPNTVNYVNLDLAPLLGLVFFEFDNIRGPVVVAQYPSDLLHPSTFQEYSDLALSNTNLRHRLITIYSINAPGHPPKRLLTYPISIYNSKYHRNAFFFNVGMVFGMDGVTSLYEPMLIELSHWLEVLEVQTGMLQGQTAAHVSLAKGRYRSELEADQNRKQMDVRYDESSQPDGITINNRGDGLPHHIKGSDLSSSIGDGGIGQHIHHPGPITSDSIGSTEGLSGTLGGEHDATYNADYSLRNALLGAVAHAFLMQLPLKGYGSIITSSGFSFRLSLPLSYPCFREHVQPPRSNSKHSSHIDDRGQWAYNTHSRSQLSDPNIPNVTTPTPFYLVDSLTYANHTIHPKNYHAIYNPSIITMTPQQQLQLLHHMATQASFQTTYPPPPSHSATTSQSLFHNQSYPHHDTTYLPLSQLILNPILSLYSVPVRLSSINDANEHSFHFMNQIFAEIDDVSPLLTLLQRTHLPPRTLLNAINVLIKTGVVIIVDLVLFSNVYSFTNRWQHHLSQQSLSVSQTASRSMIQIPSQAIPLGSSPRVTTQPTRTSSTPSQEQSTSFHDSDENHHSSTYHQDPSQKPQQSHHMSSKCVDITITFPHPNGNDNHSGDEHDGDDDLTRHNPMESSHTQVIKIDAMALGRPFHYCCSTYQCPDLTPTTSRVFYPNLTQVDKHDGLSYQDSASKSRRQGATTPQYCHNPICTVLIKKALAYSTPLTTTITPLMVARAITFLNQLQHPHQNHPLSSTTRPTADSAPHMQSHEDVLPSHPIPFEPYTLGAVWKRFGIPHVNPIRFITFFCAFGVLERIPVGFSLSSNPPPDSNHQASDSPSYLTSTAHGDQQQSSSSSLSSSSPLAYFTQPFRSIFTSITHRFPTITSAIKQSNTLITLMERSFLTSTSMTSDLWRNAEPSHFDHHYGIISTASSQYGKTLGPPHRQHALALTNTEAQEQVELDSLQRLLGVFKTGRSSTQNDHNDLSTAIGDARYDDPMFMARSRRGGYDDLHSSSESMLISPTSSTICQCGVCANIRHPTFRQLFFALSASSYINKPVGGIPTRLSQLTTCRVTTPRVTQPISSTTPMARNLDHGRPRPSQELSDYIFPASQQPPSLLHPPQVNSSTAHGGVIATPRIDVINYPLYQHQIQFLEDVFLATIEDLAATRANKSPRELEHITLIYGQFQQFIQHMERDIHKSIRYNQSIPHVIVDSQLPHFWTTAPYHEHTVVTSGSAATGSSGPSAIGAGGGGGSSTASKLSLSTAASVASSTNTSTPVAPLAGVGSMANAAIDSLHRQTSTEMENNSNYPAQTPSTASTLSNPPLLRKSTVALSTNNIHSYYSGNRHRHKPSYAPTHSHRTPPRSRSAAIPFLRNVLDVASRVFMSSASSGITSGGGTSTAQQPSSSFGNTTQQRYRHQQQLALHRHIRSHLTSTSSLLSKLATHYPHTLASAINTVVKTQFTNHMHQRPSSPRLHNHVASHESCQVNSARIMEEDQPPFALLPIHRLLTAFSTYISRYYYQLNTASGSISTKLATFLDNTNKEDSPHKLDNSDHYQDPSLHQQQYADLPDIVQLYTKKWMTLDHELELIIHTLTHKRTPLLRQTNQQGLVGLEAIATEPVKQSKSITQSSTTFVTDDLQPQKTAHHHHHQDESGMPPVSSVSSETDLHETTETLMGSKHGDNQNQHDDITTTTPAAPLDQQPNLYIDPHLSHEDGMETGSTPKPTNLHTPTGGGGGGGGAQPSDLTSTSSNMTSALKTKSSSKTTAMPPSFSHTASTIVRHGNHDDTMLPFTQDTQDYSHHNPLGVGSPHSTGHPSISNDRHHHSVVGIPSTTIPPLHNFFSLGATDTPYTPQETLTSGSDTEWVDFGGMPPSYMMPWLVHPRKRFQITSSIDGLIDIPGLFHAPARLTSSDLPFNPDSKSPGYNSTDHDEDQQTNLEHSLKAYIEYYRIHMASGNDAQLESSPEGPPQSSLAAISLTPYHHYYCQLNLAILSYPITGCAHLLQLYTAQRARISEVITMINTTFQKDALGDGLIDIHEDSSHPAVELIHVLQKLQCLHLLVVGTLGHLFVPILLTGEVSLFEMASLLQVPLHILTGFISHLFPHVVPTLGTIA